MLCSVSLTPLNKGGDDVRLIVVGELLYCIATKAILRHAYKDDSLVSYQIGVRSKGGIERILRCIELAVDRKLSFDSASVTPGDFETPSKSISRRDVAQAVKQYVPQFYHLAKWAYSHETYMPIGRKRSDSHLVELRSAPGRPSGRSLFSLAVCPLGSDYYVLAHLDDIYVLVSEAGSPFEYSPFSRQEIRRFSSTSTSAGSGASSTYRRKALASWTP